MKSFSLLSLVTVGVAQVDEQTNLLQTKTMQTLQQRSAEAEDCYVTGGCVTTTTTAAPTTTTTTAAPTTTTTTAAPTTTTTTAAPTTTTTTERRTRPTRPPTTTTTAAPTTPSFGEVVVDMPNPGAEIDPEKFCSDEAVEFHAPSLGTPKVNNLGGMGPRGAGSGTYAGQEVIAYECGIKRGDGSCVDVVISAATDAYKTAHNTRNRARSAAESKFGRTSKAFIGAYNGNSKPSVAAIGALVPGEYEFKFNFYDSTTHEPVEIGYLPMTFYDLDGKNDLSGDRRYEVASTADSEGVVSFKHSTLPESRKLKHACKKNGVCIVESVTQEVEIPNNFDTLSPAEKSAAATFLFAHKSEITINYKLNYGHRVFLFKGSKSLYCDEFKDEPAGQKAVKDPNGRFSFGRNGKFGRR